MTTLLFVGHTDFCWELLKNLKTVDFLGNYHDLHGNNIGCLLRYYDEYEQVYYNEILQYPISKEHPEILLGLQKDDGKIIGWKPVNKNRGRYFDYCLGEFWR